MDSQVHSPKAKSSEKKTVYMKFSDFLRKYRMVLIVAFGVAMVALAVVAAMSIISESALKASTASMEKLEADYGAYEAEQDQTKKAELEKSLAASADEIVGKYKGQFAAQRALSYKAKLGEARKDWAEAEKDWNAIVEGYPKSYLAPVAIASAARAAEEQGADDRALAGYKKLTEKYATSALGIPHAYFSIGRLSEGKKDYAGAMAAYMKIVSAWPDSDWTKLATDRILFLKSSGLAK